MPWGLQWDNENVMQQQARQAPTASAETLLQRQEDQGDYPRDGYETSLSPRDSPPRPPVSPITPVKSFASLASASSSSFPDSTDHQQYQNQHQQYQQSLQQQQNDQFFTGRLSNAPNAYSSQHSLSAEQQQEEQPSFIPHPPPTSLAESDNPDIIALRAAMYVLQTQKDKAKRDMQKLVQLKVDLAAEPDTFTQDLLEGRLRHECTSLDPVRATLEATDSDSEPDSAVGRPDMDTATIKEDTEPVKTEKTVSKFGAIPSKQNVVRSPHINWAKYHVIGESLEKMHEEQRMRPSGGEFGRPALGIETARAPEHLVAAPYSPFQDGHFIDSPVAYTPGGGMGLDSPHPMQTRRGSKRL